MLISVSTVTLLFAWCIYKVLSIPGETEHMHGFEMETPDEKAQKKADEKGA
ncbi:MAG: hypothetical protein Tsb0018_02540 [Opitutales bacterium]